MNLPNKLTILRVVLVPFFVFFLLTDFIPFSKIAALVIFIAASVTDALDGHIARSRNLVTTFGKFLDPLADKVLVLSALICFCRLGIVGAVPVIIIMAELRSQAKFTLILKEFRFVQRVAGVKGAEPPCRFRRSEIP
mgnify:CR=1 FL=1